MFKRNPVLTASTCKTLEMLRLAIEVLSGERTLFVHIDFNTCEARVKVGAETRELIYLHVRDDLIHFAFGYDEEWFVAQFPELAIVRVSSERYPNTVNTVAGKFSLIWVGKSATDRQQEPLFVKEAEYCAKVRGITLKQLLETKPD